MGLSVNIDSWVTLEEAEAVAKNNFISSDFFYKSWLSLSNEDKEVLLRKSAFSISDSYKFQGRKLKYSQRLAFPRVLSALPAGVSYSIYTSQLYDNGLISPYSLSSGVEEAARAQVVNAVYASVMSEKASNTQLNFSSGLKSKSIGPVSESYGDSNSLVEGALVGIYTKQVETILSSWLTSSHFSF